MKKRPFIKRKQSIHSKLEFLISRNKDITINFIAHDGAKTTQHLSDKFLEGKSTNRIVNDLHALSHDKQAKYFYI